MKKSKELSMTDLEAVYRVKEILYDFSEAVRQMIPLEENKENLDHLKSVYDMIPNASFVVGMALGSKKPSKQQIS